MAEKLQFDLVSPERLLFSGEVDMVVVPGAEGDMGIMAGHAPVMSTLRPGIVNVDAAGKPQERIFVRGGFAEVTPKGSPCRRIRALAELDAEALAREIAMPRKTSDAGRTPRSGRRKSRSAVAARSGLIAISG